jgi:hypothetical protein
MDKAKKVTFESLEKLEGESIFPDDSLDLVNKDLWNKENFHYIFHQRRKQFTKDENLLKEEFNTWHKEMGTTYFNPEIKKFIIDLLPRKQKLKAANDIAKFINYHPLLTLKDQKNLNLIKKELADKYFRNSVFNTICGTFVILTVNMKNSYERKKATFCCRKEKLPIVNFLIVLFHFYFLTIISDLQNIKF